MEVMNEFRGDQFVGLQKLRYVEEVCALVLLSLWRANEWLAQESNELRVEFLVRFFFSFSQ